MRAATMLMTFLAFPCVADDAKSPPKFADAAWLAGTWTSDPADKRQQMTEIWQKPVNGTMVGSFRMDTGGKPFLYEFLLLEETKDGVWMRLRHYGLEMVDHDEKPIRLKLSEASPKRLVFLNPDNAKPKRIVYEHDRGPLTVTIETERDGKPTTLKLKFLKEYGISGLAPDR